MIALEQSTYLGPATVLTAAGGRVKLELPDAHEWALCALAFPYRPVAGDVVLAAGRAGAWYVIGVLAGRGESTLTVPGDLTIAAPRGRVVLQARDGIDLKSDSVRVSANRLELLARSLVERFADATRWVKDVFQLRAGRIRTRVDGCYDLDAGRIAACADGDVKIDGTSINLG
jgi:uncharacterized protein DUF3540